MSPLSLRTGKSSTDPARDVPPLRHWGGFLLSGLIALACDATILQLGILVFGLHPLAARLIAHGAPREKIRLHRTGVPLEQVPFAQRSAPADGDWRYDSRTLDFISAKDGQTAANMDYRLQALAFAPSAALSLHWSRP